MTGDMPELEALAFYWADVYSISFSADRWVALRRDGRRFLVADTLTGLERAIQDDYLDDPVSRDCDSPGTGRGNRRRCAAGTLTGSTVLAPIHYHYGPVCRRAPLSAAATQVAGQR